MAVAKKLPSGAWRTQVKKTINGQIVRKSFTVHPRECGGDSRKAKFLSELNAREWQLDEEREETFGVSVRKAIDSYIKDREKVLSPSTLHDYLKMAQYFSAISEMDAKDVRTPHIQKIINEMAGSVKAKTIKNRINFLLSALDYAGNEHKFKLRYPQSVTRKQDTPDNEEVSRILRHADPIMKAILCLAAFGTMRRGEIAGLKEKDISRENKAIFIHADVVVGPDGGYVYKEFPKTSDSVRTVVLPQKVIDLLPVHESPEDFVFNLSPVAIAKRYERFKAKIGFTCRFHDLRGYAASFRSDLGIGRKYIEESGGWSKGSAVLDRVYDNTLNSTRKKYEKIANDFIVENFGDDLD